MSNSGFLIRGWMRPVTVHNSFDRETAAVRWADPQEAAKLIAKTPNELGRMRDLHVLAVACELLERLGFTKTTMEAVLCRT